MDASRDSRNGPHGGANFLVDLGGADPRSPASGFAEVVFPPFQAGRPVSRDPVQPEAPLPSIGAAASQRLVLRRGVTGSLDLYRWWDETRRATLPPTRTVTVQLLADDHRTVVLTWRFLGAYPVSLSYSPLRAMEADVVMESLELAFERVEMG